jgi:nucleoside-diphosphate-sugar epimerase
LHWVGRGFRISGMNVLILGGTGLISVGIVKHLRARGADITMFNRGQRGHEFSPGIKTIVGDRNDFPAFEGRFKSERFDVVIDMICFTPEQAQSAIRAFEGRCEQFIFCSTCCVYGAHLPAGVLVREDHPRRSHFGYGQNKAVCEDLFMAADGEGKFHATTIRPSSTYGDGHFLHDALEGNTPAWGRIARGEPVLVPGDGLGLWQLTHRDDCGKLFAYGAMNPKTYGQAYNATNPTICTWLDYYRLAGEVLGEEMKPVFAPADWIVKHDPGRFGLLKDITRYHGAFSPEKAMGDVPEFSCEIGFEEGARRMFTDIKKRGVWNDGEGDGLYDSMVKKAQGFGD